MIIKNAVLYDYKKCDIKIENGYITDINRLIDIENKNEILDINGRMLLPQFIDLNIYPKNKTISTNNIKTLYKKANNGGVGHILLIADTKPSIDNEIMAEFINNINYENRIHYTVNSIDVNEKISNITIMNSLGASGIYLQSNINANIIDKVAKYAQMLDMPIFVNAYDNLGGIINYGEISSELGIEPRNPLSEIKEVAKIIEVAIFYNIRVIFNAISEPRSIELINEAKKINPNIFSEVSMHHLLLNDSACKNYNTYAKINPPLKDEKTRQNLLKLLSDGKIDLLTSLQSEVSYENKNLVFEEAEFGIDSINNYFGILFTMFIKSNILSLDKLITLCVHNPANILNLGDKSIKIGNKVEIMIINIEKSYNIENSLYDKKNIFGVVEKLI